MRRWALASLAATLSLAGSAGDAFASGYANAVLADNPQLYWRLGEDASTGTATDRAGHYDGTYTRWNPGKGTSQPRTASPVPSALPADPDGAQAFPMNTYVETPPLPAFDTGAIEFWMRNTSTAPEASPPGNANMLWRGSDPPPSTGYWSLSGQGYACCDGALSTPAFINGTLVDYGGTIFSSGWMREEPAWHHYVARWTSTTIELWRDGQQFGSISTCCGQTSPAGRTHPHRERRPHGGDHGRDVGARRRRGLRGPAAGEDRGALRGAKRTNQPDATDDHGTGRRLRSGVSARHGVDRIGRDMDGPS